MHLVQQQPQRPVPHEELEDVDVERAPALMIPNPPETTLRTF
jgi:hypothetical protein